MHLTHKLALSSLLCAGLALPVCAQTPRPGNADANIAPHSDNGAPTKTDYTREQLLTSTVHQAWILSGKSEANFFDMVQQLAELSASNRGIKLPESAEAGRRMGEYIKNSAKADTDQLLYAVVDKAVLMTAHTPPHRAASAKPTPATPGK